jgi:ribosomal protein S18 acetylase RimI-like enzyme
LFEYQEERYSTSALDLAYHLPPWDRPFFPGNTAAITAITLRDPVAAADAFTAFRLWCEVNEVVLVSVRLAHEQMAECGFLEARGFRFIELNYRPVCTDLSRFDADPEIAIHPAVASDAAPIGDMAAQTFDVGRLHVDPEVGPEIGNRRYSAWAINAFDNPRQSVLKFLLDGQIAGFMVLEQPLPSRRFWSLCGLAPGLARQGLGRRIRRTMLAFHHSEGVKEVSTSISSHNVRVFNLYVSLGFRFPLPAMTLHWCPLGRVRGLPVSSAR